MGSSGYLSSYDRIFRLKNKAENTLKSRLIIETETSAIGDQILTDEEYIEVRIIPHLNRVWYLPNECGTCLTSVVLTIILGDFGISK